MNRGNLPGCSIIIGQSEFAIAGREVNIHNLTFLTMCNMLGLFQSNLQTSDMNVNIIRLNFLLNADG